MFEWDYDDMDKYMDITFNLPMDYPYILFNDVVLYKWTPR